MTTTQDDPLLRLYDAEQRKIRHRLIAAFIVLGLVIGALVGGFYLARSTAATATDERNVASSQADQLAGKVLTDCAQTSADPGTGPDATTCAKARAVQSDPVVQQGARGATGPAGEAGAAGADGRGITAVRVNAGGRLILTFTDGATADVGSVVGSVGMAGQDGEQGETGPQGPQGLQGKEGPQGEQGPPGGPVPPASLTSTNQDGSTTTCTLVAESAPMTPQYRCETA